MDRNHRIVALTGLLVIASVAFRVVGDRETEQRRPRWRGPT